MVAVDGRAVSRGAASGGAACPYGLKGEQEVGDSAEGVESPLIPGGRVGRAEIRNDPIKISQLVYP
jgi:hypothetical protein